MGLRQAAVDRRERGSKMRIVLHAGSNKTGSTAIQNCCNASRDVLLDAGVLYPKLGASTHHSQLLPAVLDDEEFRGNFNRSDAEGREKGVELSEGLWSDLYDQVDTTNPDILLLSSEFIFGMRPQSLERMVQRLRRYTEDIYSVVYLRDPVGHYLSSAQQVLKFGRQVKDPRIEQKYTGKVRKLKRIVPQGVECRLFSRASLYRNDVSLDLLSYVLLPEKLDRLGIKSVNSNISLSAEAMALLQQFNEVVWGDRRIVGSRLNKKMIETISSVEREHNFTKAVLKPEIKEIIERVHLKDLKQLRSEFGIEFEKFDYDLDLVEGGDLSDVETPSRVADIVDYSPERARVLNVLVMAKLAKAAAGPRRSK